MHHVNFTAALVAALSGFIVGGLWYGPLFQKAWMRHSGMSFEKGKQQHVPLVFGGAYLLNFVAAAACPCCWPTTPAGSSGCTPGR